MDKEAVVRDAEAFMRGRLPKTREKQDYLNHVFGTRKYAVILAKKLRADQLVVEVAALLHDMGADAGKDHAQESARIAKPFLSREGVPESVRKEIIGCIRNHSNNTMAESLEQQIVQDADGLIFLEDTYKSYHEISRDMYPPEKAREQSIRKIRSMSTKIRTEEGKRLARGLEEPAIDYVRKH